MATSTTVAGRRSYPKQFGLPVEGPHIDDRFLIDDLPQQGLRFGFPQLRAFTPARWLVGGDTRALWQGGSSRCAIAPATRPAT